MSQHASWLDDERQAAGACPACGAPEAMPIVYGMPMREDYERLGDRVIFAGCCVPAEPARFRCTVCGTQWGAWPAEEPAGSAFDDP